MKVITLARKPYPESTLKGIQETGCGSLNIDDTRIAGPAWKWGTQTDIRGGGYNSKRPSDGDVLARDVESNPMGRWPANMVLEHKPGCVCVGTRKVKAHPSSQYWVRSGNNSWVGVEERRKNTGLANMDGTETIEQWKCVQNCSVQKFPENAFRYFKQIQKENTNE